MIIGIMEVVKIFYKSVGKRLMENGIILILMELWLLVGSV